MKRGVNKSNIDILRDYVAGVRPFTQVGYTGKKYVKRDIGSKWTDAKGIDWEQKESGPVRVNRVADIVRGVIQEKCKCGQNIRFGSKLDSIFFRKTGLCENCLIDYETKLRILGIYDDYEQYKLMSNEIGHLKEVKDKIQEIVKFFSEDRGDIQMLCNSEGYIERWKNTNQEQVLIDSKKDLELVMQRIAILTRKRNVFKKKYKKAAVKYNLDSYGN